MQQISHLIERLQRKANKLVTDHFGTTANGVRPWVSAYARIRIPVRQAVWDEIKLQLQDQLRKENKSEA
jgi:hypothetical protein